MKFISYLWKNVTEDDLVFRVMFFNLGMVFCVLPIIAFATGTTAEVNDGAFYVVLALLFGLGSLLIYAATIGSKKLLRDLAVGAGSGVAELLVIAAFLTLSVPITCLIRYWRQRYGRSSTH